MRFLYTIGNKLYYFVILLASFFNEKAKKWIKGRKQSNNILQDKPVEKKYFWFHCASLGEFEQARPLIEKLKSDYNKNILITFFSPSGYEMRKNYPFAEHVLYLPLDTTKNAKQFIKRFNIEKAFFVKYEFWFNFLNELKKNNIPVYLISGVFRKDQLFFKPYGKWFKNQLKAFTTFFVQNDASKKLLNEHGFSNVVVSGDTRFDTVWENKLKAKPNPRIEKFKGKTKVLIAGSCWEPEEEILIESINKKIIPNDWKIIFVPHDVSKKHIDRIKTRLNEPFSLYSESTSSDNKVLIIDTIGELANAYQYGDIAFIGGGFKNALHNILEPAAFGLPVLFGPNHKKYPEADLIMKEGCAYEVASVKEFQNTLSQIDKNLHAEKVKNAQFIERFRGAVNKVIENINV
ncbi:MAG TPA: 3-deoxy-D-manno-octulosonic acid transferase [Flavobacteriales bacterium]|nr:3-deoxy-D-manno-octulosonic acid transferase [Flavobacteriales bacterium]|tara:strand:+ start:16555 stop:17766 length:1212 start_codon:yes stop_codon:yes gene_type:complete